MLGEIGWLVRACHERWDGSGYPDGLAGDEIPVIVRIVFCCDAFDAMTTARPYRPACSVADALAELRRCAGDRRDPRSGRDLLARRRACPSRPGDARVRPDLSDGRDDFQARRSAQAGLAAAERRYDRGRLLRSLILAAALAVAAVLGASGSTAARVTSPTLAQLVGQRLVVAMTGTSPGPGLLARVRTGQIGGVILSNGNVRSTAQVRALTDSLRAAARAGGQPPPLVAVDQEGGRTRRLLWAPPLLSAERLGRLSPAAVRAQGLATARALRAAGIDVDLAPVADVPNGPGSFIAARGRGFAADPAQAAALATAFAEGLADGGVAATAKHFPGLGRAAKTTDTAAVTIPASRAKLAADLVPFRSLIAAGVPLVMLSNATYTALGPKPAVLSGAVHALLRGELGFDGVTISDALDAAAVLQGRSVESASVLAAEAGTDLLLFTSGEAETAAVYARLLGRARDGTIPRASLERSYARIVAQKAKAPA